MRPIRLEFGGLQSYREPQIIDFSDLMSGGLFGIFGPTGAGKSTILDAITLALYGRVERVRGTQGIINQAENRLFVKFTFGLGQSLYRVERSYKREKGTDSVRLEYCRLVAISDGGETPLADKERDVNNKVIEILGLKLEDFTRAVVLPQGQFAEFLHLSGRERTQMLQRIFSLAQYGDKLNQRLKDRISQSEKELEGVVKARDTLGDASPEALARAEEQLRAADRLATESEAALRSVETQYRTWERVWDLQQQLAAVEADLHDWEARGPEADGWKQELDAARRAEQVRPYLDGQRQARQRAQQAADRLTRAEEALSRAKAAEEKAVVAHEEARARQEKEVPELTARRSDLQRAQGLEATLADARQKVVVLARRIEKGRAMTAEAAQKVTDGEAELRRLAGQEEELQKRLITVEVDADHRVRIAEARRLLDRLREARQALKEAQGRLEDWQRQEAEARQAAERTQADYQESQARLAECDQELAQLEGEPPADEEELRSQEAWLSRAEELIRTVADAAALLEQRRQEHQWWVAEAARLAEKAQAAAGEEKRLRDRLEEARKGVQRARTALEEARRQEHAAALVHSLVPGQPCPVCGSTEHPHPAVLATADLTEAEVAVEQAEQAVREIEVALDRAVRTAVEAGSSVDAARRREAEAAQAADQAASQLEAVRARLPEVWRSLDPGALPDALQREAAEQADRRKRYEVWQSRLTEMRKQREELSQRAATAGAGASRREAELKAVRQGVAAAQAEVELRSRTATERQQEFDRIRGEYDAAGIEAEEKRIDAADRQAAALRKQLERLRQQRKEREERLDADRQQYQKFSEALHRLETEHAAASQRVQEIEFQWKGLTGGQPAGPQLQAVEQRLQALEQAERDARAAREKAEQQRSRAAAEQAAASEACTVSQRHLREAEEALAKALTAAGFPTQAEAEAALRSPERRAELEQKIDAHEQEGTRLQNQWDTMNGQLKGQSLTAEEWQTWQRRLEQAREEAALRRDERTRALQIRDDLQAKRQRWQELEEQRQKLETLLNHLEDLKALLRGNAFVDFLAQDQMERVAAEASVRLAQLSRQRYALEVEPGGGFVIRDNDNGGLQRPVTTLSGGETFLTSLSLALALSAQIQLRGHYPLEFFFLDEGFGTLDAELLDVVISTLERLHFENLHVGVISHVPELRNRIQRRLIVHPAEPGGHGSIIEIERA